MFRRLRRVDNRWGEMLAAWAIPEEIQANVPQSPHFFDPQVFTQSAREAVARQDDSPSDRIARDALPVGGTVLDVGCGGGAASLRLRPKRVVGVDSNKLMLDALASGATALDIEAVTVEARWPDAAARCPSADVVVCHHVFYNVPDLAPFAAALAERATKRVVVELTAAHPLAWMTPYWLALHDLPRPEGPTAEDAIAVLTDLGLAPQHIRWQRDYQVLGEHGAHALESMARRLCLPPERHGELRRLLDELPPPTRREVVTIWW